MTSYWRYLLLAAMALMVLVGCTKAAETPTAVPPSTTEPTEPTTASTAVSEPPDNNTSLPLVVAYNLGETTITQARFPQESGFRNMPVQLNGLIAVPDEGEGPFPVVVVFHGTHPGCPEDEMGVDRWPCAPENEQPNYRGFDYLLQYLATQGYVALSINANAENTFGFGEPQPGERLRQLADLHLSALATAVAGGQNDFGVELNGRADLQNLVLVGHSRGGEGVLWLADGLGMAAPDAFDQFGYGPVRGLLLLAPALTFMMPTGSSVPLAAIISACDGDVIQQDGQLFYEAARMNPEQNVWVTSVWLEQANHNGFSSILGRDPFGTFSRSDCDVLLEPAVQQAFLMDYISDFLTAVFHSEVAITADPMARMGLDVLSPAPDSLYGRPARISGLTPIADRVRLMIPAVAAELTTNLTGGSVTTDGVTTFFCEEGYYTPLIKPGSEPCRRVNLTVPGHPAMVVVSWEQPGAALRFALPEGAGDLSEYTTISLRTAVDPLSPLNVAGAPQAFSVQLTDSAGTTAVAQTRPDEPALIFPPGGVEEDSFFEGGQFTGRVPMTTIRLSLADFAGVDLSQIREIALLFDQTASGTLFMGDLEVVRPAQ
jgi:hypothetical protein